MMKKYIFFIVEGKHDREEISAILNTPYFADFKTRYEPCFLLPNVAGQGKGLRYSMESGGDITADKKTTASNILGRMSELINDYKKNGRGYPIGHSDIARVVQITDTDGAFIDPTSILRTSDPKVKYRSKSIETANVDGVAGRNAKKAEVLRRLISVNQICNIPYSIFFVSCNMDHVLFDDRNMTPGRKTYYSLDFQSKCESQPEIIFDSILKPGIAMQSDYTSSWETLQLGKNSLRRITNLNLLLCELSQELMTKVTLQ